MTTDRYEGRNRRTSTQGRPQRSREDMEMRRTSSPNGKRRPSKKAQRKRRRRIILIVEILVLLLLVQDADTKKQFGLQYSL